MKLASNEALQVLSNSKGNTDDRWIKHSICVGNAAGVISKVICNGK